MSSVRNKVAALLIGLGLLGGGAFAVDTIAAPLDASPNSLAATQATPDATDQQCQDEDVDEQEANEADNDSAQNENGADDSTEGDNDADSNNDGDDEQDENSEEQESENAEPGTLTEGQDLMPQAEITLDEAITTAQDAEPGDLGTVELEERDGTLVFEVTVGDQEVFVDATTGTVASVEPAQDNEHECEDEATGEPGTLTEGQDLIPQADITLDQAITTAQDAATGDLGTVELEEDDGTLVFEVIVGDQEVTVDATTGDMLSVEQND